MTKLKNLVFGGGGANPSGIKPIAYAVKKEDVLTYPELDTESGIGYKADSDFALKPGKTWVSMYSTQGAGKAEFEQTGEDDCQCIVNKVSLKYPDLSDDAKNFANASLNTALVVVVPHYTKEGVRYVVIGGEDFDAKLTNKGNTGDKPGSAKGIDIEISAPDYMALPNYYGAIETDTGTLNCATGKFTPTEAVPPVQG